MLKNHRQSVGTPPKLTKHEQEMAALRQQHERVLKDGALRAATLVGAGVYVRTADGKLAVAKPYKQVIVPKHTA